MSIYQILRKRWLEASIAVNDPVSQAALDRFEEQYRLTLPGDFKEYLLTVNGMQGGQTDAELISFLSLEALDQDAEQNVLVGDDVEITIAEYCIYAHYYVMRASRNGERSPVFVTDGEHRKQIAPSFHQFVSQYLTSPDKVAYCWGDVATG
jgi:hypothetical protein